MPERIELRKEGGLTPGMGALQEARDNITIPVHPIVRPRGGDFCYSDSDFKIIKNDIAHILDMGFSGVVVGILDEEGNIDFLRMSELMSISATLEVTFHRAFDMCADPFTALDQLTQLGVARILTSGQQQHAESGLGLLEELLIRTQGPVIMAGSGIRLSNMQKFLQIGIRELHSSASRAVASKMRYQKTGISLSTPPDTDTSLYAVDADMVKKMISILHQQ